MKVKVSNLPTSPSETELQTLFSHYGPCEVAVQNEFAIVTYADPQHAQEAVTALDHSLFGGKVLCLKAEQADSAPTQQMNEPQEEGKARSRSRSPAKEALAMAAEDHSETQSSKLVAVQAPAAPSTSKLTDTTSLSPESQVKPEVVDPAKPEKKRSKPDVAVEEDGSKFKILSHNKRNEELSSWKCLACNRKIQKKSVKTHIASKTHKQHIS